MPIFHKLAVAIAMASMVVSVPMVHARNSLPSFCTVGGPMQTPPKKFHCPEGYEKLAGETPDEPPMFVLAWHCRSTGYSLGAIPWGGCAGRKGLAAFEADGWSLSPAQPVATTPPPKAVTVAATPPTTNNLIEPKAILGPDIDELDNRDEFLGAMVGMIERRGWRCDSISAVRSLVFSRGFEIRCNEYSYKYVIKDRGGTWTVSLK